MNSLLNLFVTPCIEQFFPILDLSIGIVLWNAFLPPVYVNGSNYDVFQNQRELPVLYLQFTYY